MWYGLCRDGTVCRKVPLINPKVSVEGFVKYLLELQNDRTLLQKLSIGAIKRAKELSWDLKANDIDQSYSRTINTGN